MYLFLLFFVLLLPLILLLLFLLLNDKIANFFRAFTLFQGKELCFFLCSKKFLIRNYSAASYMSLDRKEGVVSKISYHIRQNRVPYLEIKLEMAKKSAFFCQFSSSASFSSVYFVYLFLLFFVLLLPLILLLLLLLLNDQFANFFGAFTLFQGKELYFFLCGKIILIRP